MRSTDQPSQPDDGLDGPTTQPRAPWPRTNLRESTPPVEVPLNEMVRLLRQSLGPRTDEASWSEGPLVVSSRAPAPPPPVRVDSDHASETPEADAPDHLHIAAYRPVPEPDSALPLIISLPRPPRAPSRSGADFVVRALMETPGIGARRFSPMSVAGALALSAVLALLAAVYVLI